jgi:integrase
MRKWQQVAALALSVLLPIILLSVNNINEMRTFSIFDPGSGYYLQRLLIKVLAAFFNSSFDLVAVKVAVTPFLVALDMQHGPTKYNEAKLIIPSPEAKDQRWYILYYVHDVQKGKTTRKRLFQCNQIEDLTKRKAYCNKLIKTLNEKLQEGYVIDSVKSEEIKTKKKIASKSRITLREAIELALLPKKKLRPKTYKNYNDYANGFMKWANPGMNINEVTPEYIKQFGKHLEQKVAIRTFNNYVQHNATLWAYLVDEKIAQQNPWLTIPRRKNPTGKNIAYTTTQQIELLTLMESQFPEMKFFCEVMYYTLARPNELCLLQIKHIDLYRPKHLYIPSENSKNAHERHIVLPQAIYAKIKLLKKLPANHYIFGKGLVPNTEPTNPRYVSDAYKRRVIDKLKYPAMYTLYSWKHSGVVTNYLAGMSSGALRMQIGHTDTGSFEKYLKSLGLFENKEVMNSYVTLPKTKKP